MTEQPHPASEPPPDQPQHGAEPPPSSEAQANLPEIVEAELVRTEPAFLTIDRGQAVAAVRTAAAAAGGFLAGAATMALLNRRDVRRLSQAARRPQLPPSSPQFPTTGTRRYLVTVYTLSDPPR